MNIHDDIIKMETFSALLALCAGNSPVTGEFPAQKLVTRTYDVFFDLRLNKLLSKQSWDWWFETSLCSLWHHCNASHVSYDEIVPNAYHNTVWLQWVTVELSRCGFSDISSVGIFITPHWHSKIRSYWAPWTLLYVCTYAYVCPMVYYH